MQPHKKYNLEERLIDFAVMVIEAVDSLPVNRIGNHLGGQLIRSGTSPALNYGEALGAESRKDFVHKMKVVLKELRETLICIKILSRVKYIDSQSPIGKECDELVAIFVKSIVTANRNINTA